MERCVKCNSTELIKTETKLVKYQDKIKNLPLDKINYFNLCNLLFLKLKTITKIINSCNAKTVNKFTGKV